MPKSKRPNANERMIGNAFNNTRLAETVFRSPSMQGELWLVETKGQESLEVRFKDRAAQMW